MRAVWRVRWGGASARTLELLLQDAVVLLAEAALLLVDRPPHDVPHLVHRQKHLAGERVDALAKRGAEIGERLGRAGACAAGAPHHKSEPVA